MKYTKLEKGVRQDLFNFYNELLLWKLEVLPEFIIGQHNLNNMWYADNTMFMTHRKKTAGTPKRVNQKERIKHEL